MIRIALYKDRRVLFPDGSDPIDMCVNGLGRCGAEFTLERIKKLQPQLEKGALNRLKGKWTMGARQQKLRQQ